MTFYVRFQLYRYEGYSEERFNTIEEVLAFLNKHAGNPDFDFDVIEGRRIEFEPSEMVKAYKVKRKDR